MASAALDALAMVGRAHCPSVSGMVPAPQRRCVGSDTCNSSNGMTVMEFLTIRKWSAPLTSALLACLTIDSPAQEPAAADPDIPALIRQLGSSRVRLRDEADAALRHLPQAEVELRAIAEANPNEEAGLRATAILKVHRALFPLWTIAASVAAPPPPPGVRYTMLRHACASPDGKFVVSMFSGGALVSDGQSAEQLRVVGAPGIMSGGNWDGVRRAVAVSPDSQWIA